MAITPACHTDASPRGPLTPLIFFLAIPEHLHTFRITTMNVGRITLSALALAGAAAAINCADYNPAAPSHTPDSAVVASGLIGNVANGLLSCPALPARTTTQSIGSAGGTVSVGPHTLTIPPGALSSTKTIKAVIKSESAVRVHFEPAGLQFAKPAKLTMSYSHCGLLSSLAIRQIVYVKPDLSLLEHLLSLDNLLTRSVSTQIGHFSDYAVEQQSMSDHVIAWGPGAAR
jgi:hypothetical protein